MFLIHLLAELKVQNYTLLNQNSFEIDVCIMSGVFLSKLLSSSGFLPSMETCKLALTVISCRLLFTVVSLGHFRDTPKKEQATISLLTFTMPGLGQKYGNWTVYGCLL